MKSVFSVLWRFSSRSTLDERSGSRRRFLAWLVLAFSEMGSRLACVVVPKRVDGMKVAFELLEFRNIGRRSANPGPGGLPVGRHQLSSFPGAV